MNGNTTVTLYECAQIMRINRQTAHETLRRNGILPIGSIPDVEFCESGVYRYPVNDVAPVIDLIMSAEVQQYRDLYINHSRYISSKDAIAFLDYDEGDNEDFVYMLWQHGIKPIASPVSGEAMVIGGDIWFSREEISQLIKINI